MHAVVPFHDDSTGIRLRLLSYNIQVGIAAAGFSDYVFHGWEHLLPSTQRIRNLHRIARMIRDFDIVGLQELDSGSLRSGFINHAEYLAREAKFPHWCDKTNRKLWKVARHSMGLLSKYAPIGISRHELPARLPGRGALVARFGSPENPLVLVLAHLSLSRSARCFQMEYLSELIRDCRHVILMGDLNCSPNSRELSRFLCETSLCMPYPELFTYPSWNPKKHLDHILVSPTIATGPVEVLNYSLSDHLPITMEVSLPEEVLLPGGSEGRKTQAA
ncbi:MAG: endonuclease/exonuclease/phosphatase family protein [Desulfomonilia bacterium]|jgi:endonuclease/exonuclease/phosphatase family metal-dependent hydrolase|nr:endonuclease/exonuclease/phosphatase family protein [Desulfomonilia bacterium]